MEKVGSDDEAASGCEYDADEDDETEDEEEEKEDARETPKVPLADDALGDRL